MNTNELLTTIREALEQAQKLAYIANHPVEFKYAEAAGQVKRVNDGSASALSALDQLEARQAKRLSVDEVMHCLMGWAQIHYPYISKSSVRSLRKHLTAKAQGK